MKKYFPSQTQGYLQTNRSEDSGSLWSTFGLDFQSNLGVMKLAQKLVINTSTSDDADLGLPCAFEYFDSRWWAICGTRVFKNSSSALTSAFTEDSSSGAITSYDPYESDFAYFDNRLWASAPGQLLSKAPGSGTGAWTSRKSTANLTGESEKLGYFKKFNRLYFINESFEIGSIDTANTVAVSGDYFIDLGSTSGIISTFVTSSEFVWIATINDGSTGSTNCSILQWDGISAQASNDYRITAGGVLAMTVLDDVPYAVDSEGRVLKYSGYNFQEIQRLPINRNLLLAATASGGTNGRFIHQNGLNATKNNTLLISINNLHEDSTDSISENIPSGIWELDLATLNFTHRYPFTLKTRASSTVTDYGQNRIVSIGAVKVNTYQSDSSSGRSTILAGSKYYTDASSSSSAIFIDSPARATTDNEGQKKGYFVTSWFASNEVAASWDEIWATFRQFQNSTDSVVFKYRVKKEEPIEATITWTSTTTFTTTTDVTAYAPTATGFDGTTGGEVEVIQGTGSGSCTHIASVSYANPTYTVTLDEAVTGVTGTAKARFQKWIKIFPKDTQTTITNWSQYTIGTESNPRVQIKGCLTWTGDGEFYKFIMNSNEDIKS
jgi:hypothetical protein